MDDALDELLVMTARWDDATRRLLAERFFARLAAGAAPAAACLQALADVISEALRP